MEVYNQNNPEKEAYRMAQQKVKKLKGFYVHLIVYSLVNAFLLFSKYANLDADERFFSFSTFSTVFFWGIGLVAHGFSVFVPHFAFGKEWEDKKMKQFMEKEKKEKWE
ncbi:MAG: 2TM domain-containing protein [Bacteroidota bacterium]